MLDDCAKVLLFFLAIIVIGLMCTKLRLSGGNPNIRITAVGMGQYNNLPTRKVTVPSVLNPVMRVYTVRVSDVVNALNALGGQHSNIVATNIHIDPGTGNIIPWAMPIIPIIDPNNHATVYLQ